MKPDKMPPARRGYEETHVKFNILGHPKESSNPRYIPNDDEYNALREVFPWLIDAYKKKTANSAVKRLSR